jgi:CDGSH-type Zn-finger protein
MISDFYIVSRKLINNIEKAIAQPKKQHNVKKMKEQDQRFRKIDFVVNPIAVKDDNIFEYLTLNKNARERDKNLEEFVNPELLALNNVKFEKYRKDKFTRGLTEDEKPFPVTTRLAPYEVKDPIPGAKTYRWCSCGMSRTQPLCDGTHRGTKFKPLKFRIETATDSIHLCG